MTPKQSGRPSQRLFQDSDVVLHNLLRYILLLLLFINSFEIFLFLLPGHLSQFSNPYTNPTVRKSMIDLETRIELELRTQPAKNRSMSQQSIPRHH